MSKYPAQIDNSITLPAAVDNSTPVDAKVFNNVRSAVLQIEATLGVNPSGISSTVRGRLDTIDTTLLGAVKLSNDLGNTADHPYVIGIQGRPVSSQAPVVGEILGWNGIVWMPMLPAPGITTVFSGDIVGLYPTPTVVRIQGNAINSATLGSIQDGYALTWVNSAGQWQAKPAATGFAAGGDLSGTPTSQQVVSLTGAAGVVTGPATAITIGTVPVATVGEIRGNTTFRIYGLNGAVNAPILQWAANSIDIGSITTSGSIAIRSSSTLVHQVGGSGISAYHSSFGHIFDDDLQVATKRLYDAAVTSITFTQADKTTNSGVGAPFTIQAQNETGTTSTGGNLILNSGTGTSASGSATLSAGGTAAKFIVSDLHAAIYSTSTSYYDMSYADHTVSVGAGGKFNMYVASSPSMTFAPTASPIATVGQIRVNKDFSIKARRADNGADVPLISLDGSNNSRFESIGNATIQGNSEVDILSPSGLIAIEAATAIYLDGTAINIRDAAHSARATIETTFGHGVFGGNGAATAIVTHVGPYTGAETALAGLWFLPQGTARTTANIAIAGNGTTGDTEINSSSVIYLGIGGANKMRLSASTFQFGISYVTPQYTFYNSTAAQLSFGASATASATIVYDQNATGAGSLLSILGQQGAAGVFVGGDVLIGSGAGTGGALDGNIRFKFGTTELAGIRGDLGIGTFGGTSAAGGTNFKVHVGPMPGSGGHFQAGFSDTYGCLWALPLGSIPTYTNMIMYANSASAFFNTPTAGGIIHFIDSGSFFIAKLDRANGFRFGADVSQNPTIYQELFATTPHTFTIQAANVTTGTGSDLDLTSGTGSVTAGAVHLKTGGTTRLTANSTGVVTIANLGVGTVQSDASGNLTSSATPAVQNGGSPWHHLIITPFAGTTNTNSGTYVVAGTFELNLSELTAANGTRAITMRCVGETTSPQMSIKLYNVTAAADVTGSTLTTSSTTPVSLVTGDLTANLSAGNAIYQVQILMAAGGGGDRVILDMANIRVDWT
jgi:hypothetical protein